MSKKISYKSKKKVIFIASVIKGRLHKKCMELRNQKGKIEIGLRYIWCSWGDDTFITIGFLSNCMWIEKV